MNFKANESAQKLRGGYYTPLFLAHYLSKWVAEIAPKTIFEPSCGDGVFLEALSSHISGEATTTAIEIESAEAEKAIERTRHHPKPSAKIVCANFFEWYLQRAKSQNPFDAIVGNPPFIRYQYLTKRDQALSERIFKQHCLPFTRHTNAWVPFVVACISLLRPGGRIAMVLPAEILHVLHAQSLRYYIGQHCRQILIIDPQEIWFGGTLQGAILFLAEKKRHAKEHSIGLGIISTVGQGFLEKSPSEYGDTNFINGKTVEGKWTKALLSQQELDIFEGCASTPSVHRFGDIASVDVGLVTGANHFFLVSDATVKQYSLEKWSHPMFGRSSHCPGILYDDRQHQENSRHGLPSNFLWFDVDDVEDLSEGALQYVRSGERHNLHTRYKCRVRNPWFKVPSVYPTSVGMLKRAHDMPRLIYNEIGAYTTDTAYRIRTKRLNPKRLVSCFLNSLTALSAELEGRHYGGGVLELVPSEIERLYVPVANNIRPALRSLDTMFRTTPADDMLVEQDKTVLRGVGLSGNRIASIHDSWRKLRHRRQRLTSRTREELSQTNDIAALG